MARMPRMARTPHMARWLADYLDPTVKGQQNVAQQITLNCAP